jgi:poly-gamma-glutamate capsule biosynthesis protein CapA/YwtB (metallophosphatase superfamily)
VCSVIRLAVGHRGAATRTGAVLIALVAGLAAAACSTRAGAWNPPATGAASPSAAATKPSGPPVITLAFAGDVHFVDRTLKLLDQPNDTFGPVSAVLSAADVAMVNLESAVTTRGVPEPKTFHFRAPSLAFAAIAAAGVDLVTIANNHALDFGRVGLTDTLNAAHGFGFPVVGAGMNADEAYRAWITTVKGVRIAFIGMSQIAELSSSWAATDNREGIAMAFNEARATAAVKAAKAAADVVVVYMHWGQEGSQCPTSVQRRFAKQMADAGATMVIGTHAHVLLGDGWLGHTFVQYGLSNFVWWLNDAYSNDTGVLRVTLRGTTIAKTEFVPAEIDRVTGQPIPVTGPQAQRISTKYAKLRSCTELADGPS